MVLKSTEPLPSSLAKIAKSFGIEIAEYGVAPCLLWQKSELTFHRGGESPEVGIDFEKDYQDYRRQKVSAKKHILSRALGLDKAPGLSVLDGTLGMGKDAFLLGFLGARVVGVERDPVPALLTAWAVHNFQQEHPGTLDIEVRCQETCLFLENQTNTAPSALYLDPMFENLKSGALPKKSMALLRERQSGSPSDFKKIFETARSCGIKRIVVKRPRKGDHLFGSPSYEICGKMIRYDVYFYSED